MLTYLCQDTSKKHCTSSIIPTPNANKMPPQAWKQHAYGPKVQYADNLNNCPTFPPKTVRLVQQIVGNLLYYVIAIYVTLLVALGSIATTQSQGNEKYMKKPCGCSIIPLCTQT